MSGLKGKLTYANVMVTILAFVVLAGGGAYAASKLAKNSVGTKQLKKSAVTGEKVKDNSLTGADIDASTLGKVPSASSADKATNAGHADSASAAASATHAGDSDTVGGVAASGFGTVMSGRITGLPAGTGGHFTWGAPTGLTAYSVPSVEAVETLSPARDLVARDLSARLTATPGSGNDWTVQLVVNGGGSLECKAKGPATTCSNTAAAEPVPAGSRIAVFVLTGGAAADPVESVEWGFRLTPK